MSKQTTYDKLSLLGVDVDAISNSEAIAYIIDRSAVHQEACYVIKPYVEFLDRAYHDESVRDLLNHAELSLPDGVALTWAAAYLYAGQRNTWRFWLTAFQIVLAPHELRWPLPDRAAGTNFTWPLLQAASIAGRKVYLIGEPKNSSIGHTVQTLQQAFPHLNLVGCSSGRDPNRPAGDVSNEWLQAIAHTVTDSAADIILVGMGFPLHERVCAYLAAHTTHGVYIGEGGTFDYNAFGGQVKKAPPWMQKLGLEWLWRLMLNPHRWRRQLAIPRFMYRIWRNR